MARMSSHRDDNPYSERIPRRRFIEAEAEYLGHIVINDEIKPDATQAVSDLKALGVTRLVMLTGDKEKVAEAVSSKLRISERYSGMMPQDKVSRVEELLGGDGRLAFVGDGINDAPVLMRADVGIAMGAMGSDSAIESADVVLMDDKPDKIAAAIKIARKTMTIVRGKHSLCLGRQSGYSGTRSFRHSRYVACCLRRCRRSDNCHPQCNENNA